MDHNAKLDDFFIFACNVHPLSSRFQDFIDSSSIYILEIYFFPQKKDLKTCLQQTKNKKWPIKA
jgi:hypothetical protein